MTLRDTQVQETIEYEHACIVSLFSLAVALDQIRRQAYGCYSACLRQANTQDIVVLLRFIAQPSLFFPRLPF